MAALLTFREHPSPNWDERPAGTSPEFVMLHYTGMETARAALERLCDPAAKVSAHYQIDEDGTIWRLVAEEKRAWHAGFGSWRGISDMNARSIGIELVNPGHEFGYRPFQEAQIDALIAVLAEIDARWSIRPENLLGHSDYAPRRKEDPGELFPWARLASEGFGIWPPLPTPPMESDRDAIEENLRAIGYDLEPVHPLATVLTAFARRFLTEAVDDPSPGRLTARAAQVAQAYAAARNR